MSFEYAFDSLPVEAMFQNFVKMTQCEHLFCGFAFVFVCETRYLV